MTDQPYNRAARRAADNAHGTHRTDGPWDEGDDISRAVYPDPKARHLNGDNAIVKEKRDLAAQDVDSDPIPGKATKKP